MTLHANTPTKLLQHRVVSLPDTSGLPVILIHLGDDGRLSYKVAGLKGARWRGGFHSLGDALADAESIVPGHCLIDFVEERD